MLELQVLSFLERYTIYTVSVFCPLSIARMEGGSSVCSKVCTCTVQHPLVLLCAMHTSCNDSHGSQ